MSTQTPADGRRDPTSVARDLTDLYDILILENPEVCATCHARIRDRHEIDAEEAHDGLGTGNAPTETLVRVHEGTIAYDVDQKDEYGAVRDYRARTCCSQCGRFSGTPDATPSRRTMLSRIDDLLDVLDRHGLAVDVDTLRTTVHHLGSHEEYQARRSDIWRAATALAVRDAYY